MRMPAISVAILGACLGGSAAPTSQADAVAKEIKPCVVITGADSHVAERRCCRIASANDWARLWQEHKGQKVADQYDLFYDPLTLPLVDFDRYIVLAIFRGRGWNAAGLRIVSIIEGDRIVVTFAEKGYQTGGPNSSSARATVYGFFVLPRSEKVVVLEEEIHPRNAKDPVRKEYAVLSAER